MERAGIIEIELQILKFQNFEKLSDLTFFPTPITITPSFHHTLDYKLIFEPSEGSLQEIKMLSRHRPKSNPS